MKVIDYVDEWKADVMATVSLRFGRWPHATSEEWRPIFRALCDANADRDLADRVRDRLADNPPANMADAITAVRAAIQSEQRTHTVVGDRDQAQAASMTFSVDQETGDPMPCQDCGAATGLTYYVRRDGHPFQVKTSGGLRRTVYELPMACRCPLGRWMSSQPKNPYPDSVAYGDRVMTRRDWLTQGVDDVNEADRAREARRMVNETFSAA